MRGGLDLGFEKAGFNVVWANEYDKDIWQTYQQNHLHTQLDKRSIVNIHEDEVPECDGIIGGPPCQSWSEAGALRGIDDKRGQLFFDFIRILNAKKPQFFLAENVSGMLAPRHSLALSNIKKMFVDAGYELSFKLLNAADFEVPQDRKRVFFVGIRKDLGFKFQFPSKEQNKITLKDAIFDLKDSAIPVIGRNNKSHPDQCKVANHEYMTGGFSSMFMSRNRVRNWDEQSFTIQAGARHAPLHPQAPKMVLIAPDKRAFVKGKEHLYRRLSVRECARIQTFPDNFTFHYNNVAAGYKMIGNAVPVNLGKHIAACIKNQLEKAEDDINKNQGKKKNNHKAVKHSRLSQDLDFGYKWLGFPCSQSYFDDIRPVFDRLTTIKSSSALTRWNDIDNKQEDVYVPVLTAFRKELLRLDKAHPTNVAENLVQYLIGTKDFYKVIKTSKQIEIQGYNINKTLNKPFKQIKPKTKVQKLKLPTRLIEIVFKEKSKTTLIVSLNNGWQISFRIHSAGGSVESSLKFDINLVGTPQSLFKTHIFWEM